MPQYLGYDYVRFSLYRLRLSKVCVWHRVWSYPWHSLFRIFLVGLNCAWGRGTLGLFRLFKQKTNLILVFFFFWLFSRGLAVIRGWKVLLRLLQTWKTILGIHWIWITSKISGIFKMLGEPKIFLIWNIEDYFFPSWFSIYFKTFRKSSKNYKNPFRMLNFFFNIYIKKGWASFIDLRKVCASGI